jgi:hypothetical protein
VSKLLDALRRAEELRKQRLAHEAATKAAAATANGESPPPVATTPPPATPAANIIFDPTPNEIRVNEEASVAVAAEFELLVRDRRAAESELALLKEEVELRKNQLREATAAKRAAEQQALDAAREREEVETKRDHAIQEAITAEERATNQAREREAREREAMSAATALANLERDKAIAVTARIEADRAAAASAAQRAEDLKDKARKAQQHIDRERAAIGATHAAALEHDNARQAERPQTFVQPRPPAPSASSRWWRAAVVGVFMFLIGGFIGQRFALEGAESRPPQPVAKKSASELLPVTAKASPAFVLAPASDEVPLKLQMATALTAKSTR